jgi:6-phosphogluconate dehydrogenase (decarboxylating)
VDDLERLRDLVKACVNLDWFYVDDEMFLIWIYTNEELKHVKTVEEFLAKMDSPKDEVWLIKCYGDPKVSVFRMLKEKFKNEGIKRVIWFRNLEEVKTWML